jgi:hypothetical protein
MRRVSPPERPHERHPVGMRPVGLVLHLATVWLAAGSPLGLPLTADQSLTSDLSNQSHYQLGLPQC